MLRYAGQYSSDDCAPALRDARVCIRGDNCFEYSWELSDWTSCLINDGSEVCGVGHKERYAMCRDEAGLRVDDFKCSEVSVCLPVCLPVCQSVCLSVCLSVKGKRMDDFKCSEVSVCPSVCLPACLPACLSVCLCGRAESGRLQVL